MKELYVIYRREMYCEWEACEFYLSSNKASKRLEYLEENGKYYEYREELYFFNSESE